MQSDNPFFADLAKLMNSAAGTFAGMTREARDTARERFREAFGGLDFVSREDFGDFQAVMGAGAAAASGLSLPRSGHACDQPQEPPAPFPG